MDDLSRIRTNAVGLKMSQEELNLFHARKEEELGGHDSCVSLLS